MRTIAEVLRWRAQRHPDVMATWFEGRTRSYGALNRSSSELAAGLVERLGLKPGGRVAILDKNSDAYLELLFALDKAGLVAAPLNRRLTPYEIGLMIADFRPKLVVAGREFAGHCDGLNVPCLGFDELPRGGSDPHRDSDGAVTWQLSTSGTTGLPKGAMLTGWNVLNVGLGMALEMPELQEACPTLICLPMFHLAGAGMAVWSMQQGASLIIFREVVSDELLAAIAEHRMENVHLVPAIMHTLTELPQASTTDFSHVKRIAYGTAPIAPDLLSRCIDIFGCKFTQFYGLTEVTGPMTALANEHHSGARLLSCGRPMFGGRIRILDPEGRELPYGEAGEIVYRGPSLMAGYYGRPDATAAAIRDGWFHSGDAGVMDEDGFLFIKDRINEMIVSGGENIYPAEIEALLASHPEIAEAAVIGIPDPKWGEAVKAVVVRRAGMALTGEALIAWCAGRLASYKRPRSVDFMDALPRNASGKVLKRVLREPYWQGRKRYVN
jgi:acyl-CoA synthetase (AMP-forming)/AMP-acid ligase II